MARNFEGCGRRSNISSIFWKNYLQGDQGVWSKTLVGRAQSLFERKKMNVKVSRKILGWYGSVQRLIEEQLN